MSSIDFPNSPTVNDLFTAGTASYRWTGVAWVSNILGSIAWTDVIYKPTEFASTWTLVADKPTEFAPSAHTHVMADITDYVEPIIPEVTFSNTFMMMGA